MQIKINGREQEIEDIDTLETLAERKKLIKKNTVIELNGEIIPHTQWCEMTLKKGDLIEIVHFVGGG